MCMSNTTMLMCHNGHHVYTHLDRLPRHPHTANVTPNDNLYTFSQSLSSCTLNHHIFCTFLYHYSLNFNYTFTVYFNNNFLICILWDHCDLQSCKLVKIENHSLLIMSKWCRIMSEWCTIFKDVLLLMLHFGPFGSFGKLSPFCTICTTDATRYII